MILSACTLGVTWVGAQQVLAANLTVGELLVFLAYVAALRPAPSASQVGATLSSASASTRRVFEILDTPEEVKDRPEARQVCQGRDLEGSAGLPTSADDMFAAAGRARRVPVPPLPGLRQRHLRRRLLRVRELAAGAASDELQAPAGTSAAIIGPSGAGKTTLLNLLPRFFDPVSGAVLLEGVDLRDLRLEDLRAQIALVLQEPSGAHDRGREYLLRKPQATMEQIEAAATLPAPRRPSRSCPITIEGSSGTGARD